MSISETTVPPLLRATLGPGLLALVLQGCGDTTFSITGTSELELALEVVVTDLSAPVGLAQPIGDDRMFVIEQRGRIRVVRDGSVLGEPFLDLRGQVSVGEEQGLLGMAFHPDFGTNGFFYVHYTAPDGTSVLERYHAGPGVDVADPSSGSLILEVDQPQANHNGGQLAFGPDGMLYIGLGDGGGAGDPEANAQDPTTLLGTILRIDVDGGDPYAVPPDNPFVGDPGGRDEIWAYGLRNPWRFSFDPEGDALYIADVGQNRWEEVNIVSPDAAGLNFGWNVLEGEQCFLQSGCSSEGLTLPDFVYSHSSGCSVTGGYVYRGSSAPSLVGDYIFGDFCFGWFASLQVEGTDAVTVTELPLVPVGNITSFGQTRDGEVFVLTLDGALYRLVEL